MLPTAEIAQNVATEVGSKVLAESGWHVYSHMDHLLERRTATGKGCPFDCTCTNHPREEYWVGMLPKSDAILGRSISFGIGVKDPNLAPYGLTIGDGPDVAEARAVTFRDAVLKFVA